MRLLASLANILLLAFATAAVHADHQVPLLQHARPNRPVSAALFTELEELARIVDITYCVGLTGLGIGEPFSCLSRCKDFPNFELITTWNTGPLLSDSCGYIALDHGKKRVIVAFRGTYSISNTIVDLSTVPQAYLPYPGDGSDDDENARTTFLDTTNKIVEAISARDLPNTTQDPPPKCPNCTVHMGFQTSWSHTRPHLFPELEKTKIFYPSYTLTLVGHSLGGAVAALAGLDLLARGYAPQITTFGEPRIGNAALAEYLDARFDLTSDGDGDLPEQDSGLKYRRVTHVNDPVPLLPLSEWGYAMHAGEIFISKGSLSPDIKDVVHCRGDNDVQCIAGQDATANANLDVNVDADVNVGVATNDPVLVTRKRDLLGSVKHEIEDVRTEPWGIPSRYKLWELFFAHRDYFWRLGLCVPGGDPLGGGGKYE